ncbi:hypothetical protein GQ457_09G007650 [Hibiscus cannabinus]
MTFQDPWYRYPSGGIDTQGTDTLREVPIPYKGGIDTHCPEWARKAEKHPQRLQTRSNGHQRLESLLGP